MKKFVEKNCCGKKKEKMGLEGIIYGILPHSFCIAFVLFSVIGATAATTIFKRFFLIPYFFEILIGLSLIFATISAILYLKRKEELSFRGIGKNFKYLVILFGTTILVNLFFFFVIFPWTTNLGEKQKVGVLGEVRSLREGTLQVKIPCSGHASLIIGEIKKVPGVESVKFVMPDKFIVNYDPTKTDLGEILKLEIFKTFPAVLSMV